MKTLNGYEVENPVAYAFALGEKLMFLQTECYDEADISKLFAQYDKLLEYFKNAYVKRSEIGEEAGEAVQGEHSKSQVCPLCGSSGQELFNLRWV